MGLNLGVMGTESWTSAWWDGRGRSWALHTQRHCPKPSVGLRAEKASNAPLMALFSFAAFLAFSIGRQPGPPPKTALRSAGSIGACYFICSL